MSAGGNVRSYLGGESEDHSLIFLENGQSCSDYVLSLLLCFFP